MLANELCNCDNRLQNHVVSSAILVEAMAILKACELSVLYGWEKVVVESYDKLLVEVLNGNGDKCDWRCSTVIENIFVLANYMLDLSFYGSTLLLLFFWVCLLGLNSNSFCLVIKFICFWHKKPQNIYKV